jgi:hypothetical protein
VARAEAERRRARADVIPVVVVVGDTEVALVLGAVVVGMADEGCLPLICVSVTTTY